MEYSQSMFEKHVKELFNESQIDSMIETISRRSNVLFFN